MTFWDKVKQQVWRGIYRIFPAVQRTLLKWRIVWHEKGRQHYHLGWLAPGRTLEELKRYLHETWHFGNHFIAWVDEGQVLSWRKLDGFRRQYHLRVFTDGEIRGHYEYTPEAHPIDHFREKGEEERHEDFVKFLGEFLTSEATAHSLVVDPDAWNPDSQITYAHTQKLQANMPS